MTRPTLLITRPAHASEAFRHAVQQVSTVPFDVVISPLIEIESVGKVPDLAEYRSVILTSQNAVRVAGRRLQGRNVVTVGEATARLAEDFGARATSLGANAEEFVGKIDTIEGPAIHLRGEHTRGGIAEHALQAGLSMNEAVIYDQTARPLSPQAKETLTSGAPVIAPLFSPRSAALFRSEAGVIGDQMEIVAISDAVAEIFASETLNIAPEPTLGSMVAVTVRLLQDRGLAGC